MQDAVIYEFLNNEQQQKDCHFIFSVWNLPEESEDQALPYEDEEDEDNGLAQSLAVTTQASSSAEQEWHRVFQLVDSLLVSERLRRRLKWSASPNAGDHEQGESATSLLEGFPSGPPLLIANTPARAENVAKSVPQRSPPRKSSANQTYHHSLAPNPTHHRSLASASHKRFWSSSSEPDNKRNRLPHVHQRSPQQSSIMVLMQHRPPLSGHAFGLAYFPGM